MKIISAHQPAYLPWLGYFHKILLSDEFVIMDDVQYEKNSYINRNQIVNNKQKFWLTIPLINKSDNSGIIKEMELANHIWKVKHIKSIEYSYKKSPFFSEIMPIIESSLEIQSNYLIDYTNSFLFQILDYLDIETKIHFASDLKIRSKKLDYVVELTKKLEGDLFVFGKLGSDYANKSTFEGNGIKAYFQNYLHPDYRQYNQDDFFSHISIIDLLFNYGSIETVSVIMRSNVSKQDIVNYQG
ncbi:WbqC family protein [Mongoliibacter ruber]|uniref:WbqC-like protein n=1 Tax=Mongoliibacter ruber TaxID=1750599 RepID=A0A2T0WG34_9BACT|nr:WbqC family protein [Mongoliibacter ruber]PRY85673.1 WbqC-like protein [Mongoliibacter ruber]